MKCRNSHGCLSNLARNPTFFTICRCAMCALLLDPDCRPTQNNSLWYDGHFGMVWRWRREKRRRVFHACDRSRTRTAQGTAFASRMKPLRPSTSAQIETGLAVIAYLKEERIRRQIRPSPSQAKRFPQWCQSYRPGGYGSGSTCAASAKIKHPRNIRHTSSLIYFLYGQRVPNPARCEAYPLALILCAPVAGCSASLP